MQIPAITNGVAGIAGVSGLLRRPGRRRLGLRLGLRLGGGFGSMLTQRDLQPERPRRTRPRPTRSRSPPARPPTSPPSSWTSSRPTSRCSSPSRCATRRSTRTRRSSGCRSSPPAPPAEPPPPRLTPRLAHAQLRKHQGHVAQPRAARPAHAGACRSCSSLVTAYFLFRSPRSRATRRSRPASRRRRPTGSPRRSPAPASPTSSATAAPTVSVVASQLSAAQVALASAGVGPGAQPGFELFTKTSLGTTDFQQQVEVPARARGRDRAHDREHRRRQRPPRCSSCCPRTRCSRPGLAGDRRGAPDRPTRRSTRAPCAASPTWSPPASRASIRQNVTITDQTGALLWPSGVGGAGGSRRDVEAAGRAELRLAARRQVDALLAQTLGAGKAQARVNADLNSTRSTIDSVTYDGTKVPLTSADDQGERCSRRAAARPASPARPPTSRRSTPAGERRRTAPRPSTRTPAGNTTYGVDKTVSAHRRRPGRRQPAARRAPRRLVRAAEGPARRCRRPSPTMVGIDPSRGDTLSVSSVPFQKPTAATGAAGGPLGMIGVSSPLGLVRDALLGLAALVFLFLLRRNLKRREGEARFAEPTWLREISQATPLAELEAGRTTCRPAPPQHREPMQKAGRGDRPAPARARRPPGAAVDERVARAPTTLTGRHKAAILLRLARRATAPPRSSSTCPNEMIEQLTVEMARTPTVEPRARPSTCCEEIVETGVRPRLHRRGRRCATPARCSSRRVGAPRADEILNRLSVDRSRRRRSSSCAATPPDQIAAFLRNEHPQTIALVVAHLPDHRPRREGDGAARRPSCRPTSPMRIATMDQTSPDVVKEVARGDEGASSRRVAPARVRGRRRRAARSPRSSTPPTAPPSATSSSTSQEARPRARRRGARAAVRLRGHPQARRPLDPAGAQGGRHEGSRARAARRLEDVQERILANMSQRGAEMLREEMEFMPPQRRARRRGGAVEDRRRRAQARGRRRDRDLARRRATRTS